MAWNEDRMPSEQAMPAETHRLYRLLQSHRGKAEAVSMLDLYESWSGYRLARWPGTTKPMNDVATLSRGMRKCIDELRDVYGIPVMSSSQAGYWIAGDAKELDQVYREFRARGLKSLSTAARLKKITLAEEVRQIELELHTRGTGGTR